MRMRNVLPAVVVALLIFSIAGAEDAANWPRFHGPNLDNKSPDTGLLKSWPEGGPKLLKTVSGLGHGFSSPAIADGVIYITGIVDGKQQIKAVGMDGSEKWTVTNGPGWTKGHPGARCTPTVVGERLYVLSGHGQVGIFDAKTGASEGKIQLREKFGGKAPSWGFSECLLVDGDLLICTPGGSGAAVVAYNTKTGKLAWKTADSSDQASYCAPVAFDLDGVRQIATMTATEAIGIDARTGGVLWRYGHRNRHKVNATPMIFKDGLIYGTSGYGLGGFLLDIRGASGGKRLKAEWTDKALDNHHGGCVMLDGHVYGSSSKGRWVCLDFKSGDVKYRTRGVGKGSLTYADGMLYCLSERGTMGLVKADPKRHEVVSRFKVPKGGRGPYWAHPVVIGGRLYLRHSDKLFIYDVSAPRERD